MIASAMPARSTTVLTSMTALLAVAAVWPWVMPGEAPKAMPAASRSNPPSTLPADLPPLSGYAETIQRPLFAPTRRPPVVDRPPPPAAANPEIRYRLLGLMTSGHEHRALVAEGARTFEIGEGQTLDGWTIKRIEQDRVVLSSPLRDIVLTLRDAARAAASGTAASIVPAEQRAKPPF